MASNLDTKKPQRKADEGLEDRRCRRGKQPHQKMKPYLVLQYLQRESDEEHPQSAFDIISYLDGEFGIKADRRSIYSDIEEINRIHWMQENEVQFSEFEEDPIIEDDADKLIVYTKKPVKGFYINPDARKYDFDDNRLLAECVYSAKFIAQGQAERLVRAVSEFGSVHQADAIRHDALLTDRVKTNNRSVLNNISRINQAMVKSKTHEPEKISFKYQEHTIDNLDKPKLRRNGELYIVSPWRLLINDGNYYLLGYDSKYKKMLTYDESNQEAGITYRE